MSDMSNLSNDPHISFCSKFPPNLHLIVPSLWRRLISSTEHWFKLGMATWFGMRKSKTVCWRTLATPQHTHSAGIKTFALRNFHHHRKTGVMHSNKHHMVSNYRSNIIHSKHFKGSTFPDQSSACLVDNPRNANISGCCKQLQLALCFTSSCTPWPVKLIFPFSWLLHKTLLKPNSKELQRNPIVSEDALFSKRAKRTNKTALLM